MDIRIVDHLERDYQKPIRDPLWKHIYASDPIQKLLDTPACRQLSRIKQLGPAYLVYPGATHTRLSHSLGVFDIARRMVRRLLVVDPALDVSLEGVKAFLIAALLHDLGHFPYTHSLKELALKEHEVLTAELVQSEPLAALIRDEVGTDPAMVAAIVDSSLPATAGGEVGFFRAILSGTLDPDKLDYLNRDAYFCGVPYGVQDIDFILSRIRTAGRSGIAIEASGVPAVESVLFAKYLMYRAVYWHRTVRVATAMIKKAVSQALSDQRIQPTDLYGLDDDLFFVQFARRDYPVFELIRRVYDRRLYRPVYEAAFDPDDPVHAALCDPAVRTEREARIAARLDRVLAVPVSPASVIIDVPEEIGFEIHLPVVNTTGSLDFPRSQTVFTAGVIADFARTLRRLRLIVAPEIASAVRNPQELLTC